MIIEAVRAVDYYRNQQLVVLVLGFDERTEAFHGWVRVEGTDDPSEPISFTPVEVAALNRGQAVWMGDWVYTRDD